MKALFTLLCFGALFFPRSEEGHIPLIPTRDTYTLSIQVKGIKRQQGVIRVCLVQQKEDFLRDCFKSQVKQVQGKEVNLTFSELPSGTYAISLYHDEDGNGKLNRSKLMGLPREPYGFSNNPSSLFGPPKYEKCTFPFPANHTLTITL